MKNKYLFFLLAGPLRCLESWRLMFYCNGVGDGGHTGEGHADGLGLRKGLEAGVSALSPLEQGPGGKVHGGPFKGLPH